MTHDKNYKYSYIYIIYNILKLKKIGDWQSISVSLVLLQSITGCPEKKSLNKKFKLRKLIKPSVRICDVPGGQRGRFRTGI